MPAPKMATLKHKRALRMNCQVHFTQQTEPKRLSALNNCKNWQIYLQGIKSGRILLCPWNGQWSAQQDRSATVNQAPNSADRLSFTDTEWLATPASDLMGIFYQITSPNPLKNISDRSNTTGPMRMQNQDAARASGSIWVWGRLWRQRLLNESSW